MTSIRYLDYSLLSPLFAPPDSSQNQTLINNDPHTNYAFVVLNRPIAMDEFAPLWINSSLRVIVDGSANRIVKITYNGNDIKHHTELPPFDPALFCDERDQCTIDGNIVDDFSYEPLSDNNNNNNNTGQLSPTQFTGFMDLTPDMIDHYMAVHNITITPLFPITYPPDIVLGDLDSAHPVVLRYLTKLGTHIIQTLNQDYSDFQKSLYHIAKFKGDLTPILNPINLSRMNAEMAAAEEFEDIRARKLSFDVVVCSNCFGGRFDQFMSIVSSLHSYSLLFFRILLLGDDNIVELIPPTTTILNLAEVVKKARQNRFIPHKHANAQQRKVYCGVIPFLGETLASWSGLEWPLGNDHDNVILLKQCVEYLGYKCNGTDLQNGEYSIADDHALTELLRTQVRVVQDNATTTAVNGLLSTNNWLSPIELNLDHIISHDNSPNSVTTHPFAIFQTTLPMVLSLTYPTKR